MNISVSALTVAKYFLSLSDEDSGDLVSNLKLQKLLYYAQGCWVAVNGTDKPLFKEKIYAWKHGPVVKTVYNHYASHGPNALPIEKKPALRPDIVEFLKEIYRVFGRYSAWQLREMTHREPPWIETYRAGVKDIEIPLVTMSGYFTRHVKKAA